jgi:hypothetical protein
MSALTRFSAIGFEMRMSMEIQQSGNRGIGDQNNRSTFAAVATVRTA